MGKVITAAGLQDFIETGAVTHVQNHVKGQPTPVPTTTNVAPPPAPPASTPPSAPIDAVAPPIAPVEASSAVSAAAPDADVEDSGDRFQGISEADKNWIKSAPDEVEETKRWAAKRHKVALQEEALRKKAQEEAEDAEDFAKSQYERARLAEQRSTELERELSEAKTTAERAIQEAAEAKRGQEVKPPDIKEFTDAAGATDWVKYTEARETYAAQKAVSDDRQARSQQEEADRQKQIEVAFRSRIDAATEKYPDFFEVVGKTDVIIPTAALTAISLSEYAADVTYYLAKHRDQALQIARLPSIPAIREISRLERLFEKQAAATPPQAESAPAPKPAAVAAAPAPIAASPPPAPAVPKVTEQRGGAPPPINPISAQGSGTVVTDPSKMDFKQLRNFRREQQRNKRR